MESSLNKSFADRQSVLLKNLSGLREVPPRVEYALSELGESMRPIIKSMEAWGNNYKQGLEE